MYLRTGFNVYDLSAIIGELTLMNCGTEAFLTPTRLISTDYFVFS